MLICRMYRIRRVLRHSFRVQCRTLSRVGLLGTIDLRTIFLTVLTLASLTILVPDKVAAEGFKVVSYEWGFDNRMELPGFQLLRVHVRNSGTTPVKVRLSLVSAMGLTQRGAAHVRDLFLSPGSSKRLSFYPYAGDSWAEWRLQWGPARGLDLQSPKATGQSVVFLRSSDKFAHLPPTLAPFPAADFPSVVAVTRGLEAVWIDHQPDWSPPVIESFATWLHSGGTVHLLHDKSGGYPQLFPELSALVAELKDGVDETFLGAGRVYLHPVSAAELTPADVTRFVRTPIEVSDRDGAPVDGMLIRSLKNRLRPDHPWTAIWFFCALYLIVMMPLCWWLGRGRRARTILAIRLAAIALTSFVFIQLGARGYGEQGKTLTITMATAAGGQKYAISQWGVVFVTEGGRYQLDHGGSGSAYATVLEESVQGAIAGAEDSHFVFELPLFSARDYYHEGVHDGPLCRVEQASSVGTDPAFRWHGPALLTQPFLLYKGSLQKLVARGDRYVSDRTISSEDVERAARFALESRQRSNWRNSDGQEPLMIPLIWRALGLPQPDWRWDLSSKTPELLAELPVSYEMAHLFFLTESSAAFAPDPARSHVPAAEGVTFYHFPIRIED